MQLQPGPEMDHSLSSSLDGWQNEPQVGQPSVPRQILKRVKRYSLWAAIILIIRMVLEISIGANAIQPMLKLIATDLNEIRERTRDNFYIKGEEEIVDVQKAQAERAEKNKENSKSR